jgi:hypothetical protein
MTKITHALITSAVLAMSSAPHLIAQDEACLGISRDTINWLGFTGGGGFIEGDAELRLAAFQSDDDDGATIIIIPHRLENGEQTIFRPGYPREVTDGAGLTGWDIVNGNAANDSVLFPMTEYSMLNEDGGDSVGLSIGYVFDNPLPAGSLLAVSRFNWQKSGGRRTRAFVTAEDEAGNLLPPTTLVLVDNYNFQNRSSIESRGWNLDYNDITGELAHEKPGLLANFDDIDTDLVLLTTTEPITYLEFAVDESPIDEVHSEPFRIGIGKPAFAIRNGKFHGLIDNESPTTFNTGSGLLKVNDKGGFSASFRFDGVAYRFGGKFNAEGNDWSGTVTSRDGPAVDVSMKFGADYTGLGLAVNGTIDGTPGNSTFSLMFSPYASGCELPIDIGGPYTALIGSPAVASDDLPAGQCYAMGSVRQNGYAGFYTRTTGNVVGYAGGYLNRLNEFAFQSNSHTQRSNKRREDIIIGTIVFQEVANTSDFDGTLTLYKTDDTRYRNYYPSGYEYEASIIGSHYFPPAPGDVNIGDVMVDGLSLSDNFSLAGRRANFTDTANFKRARFSPITGEIGGRYKNSVGGRWRAFGGVLFQKTQVGGGWAMGSYRRNEPGKIGLFLINAEPEIIIGDDFAPVVRALQNPQRVKGRLPVERITTVKTFRRYPVPRADPGASAKFPLIH